MASAQGRARGIGLLIVMGIALAGAPAVLGQSTGDVLVTVYVVRDGHEEVAAGAAVSLRAAGRDWQAGGVTGEDGTYRFTGVPAGVYVLEAGRPGFATTSRDDVEIVPGAVGAYAIALTPERVERAEVTARSELVQLERGTTSTTELSRELFEDLPVFGRRYQNALKMAPGVQDSDGDGAPNVHGSREEDFKMTVQGLSNQDPFTGLQMLEINADAIDEIQIIDAGADATFGGAVGGYGRMTLKSGGNELHGSATLYFRDSIFDNDGGTRQRPLDYGVFRPAGYLSGPLVRDHAWFMLSHEYLDMSYPVDLIGGPDFVQEVGGWLHADQLTWQVTGQDKLQLLYTADPIRIAPDDVSVLVPAESGTIFEGGGQRISLAWTRLLSETFSFDVQAGYSRSEPSRMPYDRSALNDCNLVPQVTFLRKEYCVDRANGSRRSGPHHVDIAAPRTLRTYRFDMMKYVQDWLTASHELKAGLVFEQAFYEQDVTLRDVLFRDAFTIETPTIPPPIELFTVRRWWPQSQLSTATRDSIDLYVQDTVSWDNLSVTAGLRVMREEASSDGYVPIDPHAERRAFDALLDGCVAANCAPLIGGPYEKHYNLCVKSCAADKMYAFTAHPIDAYWASDPALTCSTTGAMEGREMRPNGMVCTWIQAARGEIVSRQPERYTIANVDVDPRVHVAWDPLGDGRTKIAASWGRYHGSTFLAPLVGEAGPDSTHFEFTQYRGVPSFDTNSTDTAFSIRQLDRDLERQYVDEWQLRFEREVAEETAIAARYVNRRYRDYLQDTDINHVPVYWDDIKDIASMYGFCHCEQIGPYADCTGKHRLKSYG